MAKGKLARSSKKYYTLKDVEIGIKRKNQLYSYAESGDFDAVHLIIDAEKALRLANPTALQIKTIQLYWVEGYTLKETGNILGVTAQAVKFNLELLKVKIKKVLDRWSAKERREEAQFESHR